MEDFFKTLGDENRLRILNLLMNYELCVCEIEVILGLNQSNVSRHLGKLKSNGLISGYKDAQWIHYKIDVDFRRNNKLLVDYLIDSFKSHEIYGEDLRKCKLYVESPYTCQTITNELELVLNHINQ